MSDSKEHKNSVSDGYKEARDAFENLKVEEKAIFLVEGAVHTIARGIQDAFHALAVEVNSCFDQENEEAEHATSEEPTADAASEEESPKAKPATPKKAAPAKKTTKRTTSRRSTSRRTTKKDEDTKPNDDQA